MEVHGYEFTMAGKCGVCGQVIEQHPVMLSEPDPMTDCIVDHRSISTAFRIGEYGGEWKRCPSCNRMIEGAMAAGFAVGPVYGPGRGIITERMKSRLLFVNFRNLGVH